MAEVFLARAQGANGIGKFLAVKRILPQFSDNDDFIDMFKDEAKIAINLSHSNIVPIFEFGISNKQLFLVMAYIEGRNLRQILNKMKKAKKFFSIEQVVYICKEIAAGLDHAHRCLDGTTGKPLSITHRDMSPQNVMISFEGEVKVIDFGIAKAETQLETTRAGTLKGKFGYMSPEQAEGQPIDLRTDIFSLGIVLWELLANDRLFIANNEINTLRKIRDCRVPSLRKINPNVPPELEKIVYKALAKDRNLRYQTASALQRDLNRFLNRHYPDFAPQDFAGAIKSLYMDEILDNRKRLISYAKQTSELEQPKKAVSEEPDYGTASFASNSFNNPEQDEFPEEKAVQQVTKSHSNSLAYQLSEMNAQMEADDPNDFSSMNASREDNLDVEKIMNEIKKVSHHSPSALRKHSYTSDGHTNSRFTKPGLNSDSYAQIDSHSNFSYSDNSSIVKTVAIIGVVLGGFFLANQIFPKITAHIKNAAVTSGVLPVDKTEIASVTNNNPTKTDDPVAPKPLLKLDNSDPATQQVLEGSLRVSIKSSPSGAAIYLNNVNTFKRTPAVITVPSPDVKITLKKAGYETQEIDTGGNLTNRRSLRVNLFPAKIAYLSIDILPPVPANIYIDGNQILGKPFPIIKHSVSANKDITIRAVSPTTGVSVTRQVRLREKQTQQINFDLTRRPASRKR